MSGDAPWAMQLAVRDERGVDLADDDVAAAAARAALGVLASPRARPGGEWAPAIAAWTEGGRIRKVVRRGRGAPWEAAAALPGASARVGAAVVRAFVPGPTDQVPRPLAKLQVAGLVTVPGDGPADPWSACPVVETLVVAVTPLLDMTAGKVAAQVAHAAHLGWAGATDDRRRSWALHGFPLLVARPGAGPWGAWVDGADVEVHDGGFTEVPAGSLTVAARWAGPQPQPGVTPR